MSKGKINLKSYQFKKKKIKYLIFWMGKDFPKTLID